ncbi:MAG: VOC family protein [Angustibacter sp.]
MESPAAQQSPTEVRPEVRQVVLDTPDARGLAEFYRVLLGWEYRPGDAPPPPGQGDERGQDWLVLQPPGGGIGISFQQEPRQRPATWPDHQVPQQLHLDMTVTDTAELAEVHRRVLALGGRELLDRTDDPDEPLHVYADPAGHPFCVFVG